jgi:hypothetical protein
MSRSPSAGDRPCAKANGASRSLEQARPDRFRPRAKEGSRCFRSRPRREQRPQRRDEGERLVDHHVMFGLGDYDAGRARRDEAHEVVGVDLLNELRSRPAARARRATRARATRSCACALRRRRSRTVSSGCRKRRLGSPIISPSSPPFRAAATTTRSIPPLRRFDISGPRQRRRLAQNTSMEKILLGD